MNYRKTKYFGKNSIGFEIGYLPMAQIGLSFDEDITFSIGLFIQLYLKLESHKIWSWLYQHDMNDRELRFDVWFMNGCSIGISLFAKSMEWKRGDLKWHINLGDKIKGKSKLSKKIIEKREVLIPMPEKSYKATATLADWTWSFQRWFPVTIRRCEIEIEGGIPFPGKGENSWDCGDDSIYSMCTGNIKDIPDAVGQLVSSVLRDRVKNGGWDSYSWNK